VKQLSAATNGKWVGGQNVSNNPISIIVTDDDLEMTITLFPSLDQAKRFWSQLGDTIMEIEDSRA